jgi:hypothetical protein
LEPWTTRDNGQRMAESLQVAHGGAKVPRDGGICQPILAWTLQSAKRAERMNRRMAGRCGRMTIRVIVPP